MADISIKNESEISDNNESVGSSDNSPPGNTVKNINTIYHIGDIEMWNQIPSEVMDNQVLAVESLRKTLRSFSHTIEKPNLTNDIKITASCDNVPEVKSISRRVINFLKPTILFLIWLVFTTILMTKREHNVGVYHQISIPKEEFKNFLIVTEPNMKQVSISIGGALMPPFYGNMSKHWLSLWIELVQTNVSKKSKMVSEKHVTYYQRISEQWDVPTVSDNLIDYVPEVKHSKIFNLFKIDKELAEKSIMRLQMMTNLESTLPISLNYDLNPIDPEDGVIYAAIILLGLYILIIFEIVHRTLAAVIAATMAIAVLAAFDERPTEEEITEWINVETLLLLFSMMVLVAIFSETGVFNYLAVLAYRITGGRIWPLIDTLCLFTALVSCFLDNVTTALLMTPVTIRLCEVMQLDPVPVLTAMIMYSNIGGALTPVGDPPNVIIATNTDIMTAGVSFGVFLLHMGIGLFLVMIVVRFQLKYMYRNINNLRLQHLSGLHHEIVIWKRAAASLSSYSKDEETIRDTLMKRVRRLLTVLKFQITSGDNVSSAYNENLEQLQSKYPIRDMKLLIQSAVSLLFVISLFFLHSVLDLKLSLGLAALLGVILLLILSGWDDVVSVLARVEWSTLIFFTALFVLMEALARLGLINWIGRQTENIILKVEEDYRLAVAIVLILWVSAIASSFIDNIPLTTMMVKIVTSLSENRELGLPLQPLVWALALGACLGGNGTLIGASANMVCAGVAEQHGYKFTFLQFFKIGFPVMLSSVSIVTVYLLVAHVLLGWNS